MNNLLNPNFASLNPSGFSHSPMTAPTMVKSTMFQPRSFTVVNQRYHGFSWDIYEIYVMS